MSEKPKRQPADDIEELPDAWERFESAFDKVMKAKPMPARKAREPLPFLGRASFPANESKICR
jgi:hypothetical protein